MLFSNSIRENFILFLLRYFMQLLAQNSNFFGFAFFSKTL